MKHFKLHFHKLYKKSFFWKIFAMVSIMSIASMIIFAVFINFLMVNSQRSRIHELSLTRLRQTSQEIETRLDALEESMERTLWSQAFVSLMVNPMARNSDSNFGIINTLSGYASGNTLISRAWLYVTALDEIYSSGGNYLARELAAECAATDYYLGSCAQSHATGQELGCKVFCFEGRLIQTVDFCVPNFIGALFFEINLDLIDQLVQEEAVSETEGAQELVYIYDENQQELLGRSPEEAPDFDDASLFMTIEQREEAPWYRYSSEKLGWVFLRSAEGKASSLISSWNTIMSVMVSFLLLYFAGSQLLAVYVTRSVYRPIHRLMQITNGWEKEEASEQAHNEIDYLELVYTDVLGKNQQHQKLMASISNDIMEQLFRNILNGRSITPEALAHTLEGTGNAILMRGRYLVLAGFILTPEDREPTVVETGLYQRSLLELACHSGEDDWRRFPLYMDTGILSIVCWFSEDTSAISMKQKLKLFVDTLHEKSQDLPYRVLVGQGKTYNEILFLRQSYMEALGDIRYQRYTLDGANQKLSDDEYERKYFEERAHQVIELAEKGSREEAEHASEDLVKELSQCERERQLTCCELVIDTVLEKLISEQLGDSTFHDNSFSRSREGLEQLLNDAKLPSYMTQFFSNAISDIQTGSKKSRFKYVNEAREYIEANFFDGNLSLNMVSEAIGISAPYLSGLFNEVMKENFSAYLNDYRIKQARKFLEETSLNVSEIGYKCGFNSAQSFSRVFKKHTGFTPGQYREKKKGEVCG